MGLGFHFEDEAEEDLNFFASDCDKRGFFAGGRELKASDRERFRIGDEGVEDGEEVEGSGTGSSGGGEDEERVDLLLLL